MNDSMNCLFSYILERRLQDYLPGPAYLLLSSRWDTQREALKSCLSPDQFTLLEALMETRERQAQMDLEALFCAGRAVFREPL